MLCSWEVFLENDFSRSYYVRAILALYTELRHLHKRKKMFNICRNDSIVRTSVVAIIYRQFKSSVCICASDLFQPPENIPDQCPYRLIHHLGEGVKTGRNHILKIGPIGSTSKIVLLILKTNGTTYQNSKYHGQSYTTAIVNT